MICISTFHFWRTSTICNRSTIQARSNVRVAPKLFKPHVTSLETTSLSHIEVFLCADLCSASLVDEKGVGILKGKEKERERETQRTDTIVNLTLWNMIGLLHRRQHNSIQQFCIILLANPQVAAEFLANRVFDDV